MRRVPRLAIIVAGLFCASVVSSAAQEVPSPATYKMKKADEQRLADLQARWEKFIVADYAASRYCDTEKAEELAWLVAPYLNAFFYGYVATKNPKWIDMLVDCADSWLPRGVTEPDGFIGWPKRGWAGSKVDNLDDWTADSMLGEAAVLTPIVSMAREILATPGLAAAYGAKARSYLQTSKQIFEKWRQRGAWRETEGGGIVTVELPFGIDEKTGDWTAGYAKRNDLSIGFSHQNNKANLIARWLVAMFDATGEKDFRERAEGWFRLMKSRMSLKRDGSFQIWNYWQPAGPWDYRFLDVPKHWIGVHPNQSYYDIDVESIVLAYEHGLVFSKDDIDRLIATALTENRYWIGLVPYDERLQKRFENRLEPTRWSGLVATPWYLARQSALREASR
jgi:hypothetical protein